MTAYVIDASVAVKWFVAEPGSDTALDIVRGAHELMAPDFILVEVATALSRRERLGEIPSGQALADVVNIWRYFRTLSVSQLFLTEAMELSITLRHPFSDCLYLAVALADHGRRDVTLITADDEFVAKLTGTPFAGKARLLADWAT